MLIGTYIYHPLTVLWIFAFFDHISYKRWLPIYYEDCLALPKRFPKMYQSFLNRDFVVRQFSRKCSAVPMDQALEKAYNKPAKSSAGIIGFTRRKETVCRCNLIKHEKAKYLHEHRLSNK